MGEQLTMLDTMFLELEEAQDTSHMHIGVALIFDPPPDGAPSIEALADRFAERIGAMPQFAQRLSQPSTDLMSWLTWEPMPDFDVREHLRRATLPAPGGPPGTRAALRVKSTAPCRPTAEPASDATNVSVDHPTGDVHRPSLSPEQASVLFIFSAAVLASSSLKPRFHR